MSTTAATTQKMSVTQGLAELKMLDKRINTHLRHLRWCDVSTEANRVDAEKLKGKAEAEYQSYMDLVKRRDSIKRAIVLSNATTRVKVADWEGTVAEAIEHKSSIEYKRRLLESMKEQLQESRGKYEAAKGQMDSRLERLLQSELGKDVKTNPDTLAALTNTFRAQNKVELVDPLDLAAKVAALEEEITSFETNVDWVLSEANGKTAVEIPSCSSKVAVPSYKPTEAVGGYFS
jgi:hypothetical protein